MQAIYFPSKLVDLKTDEKFFISCQHDEYSFKFDVHTFSEKNLILNSSQITGDINLGLTLVSRNRLSQLNNEKRNNMFISLLKKVFFYLIKIS